MKNTTRQWLIACICLFYFVPLSIAQKNLVMVHGLGGGVNSLGGYGTTFQTERQIGQAVNFEHNSAVSVSVAASDSRDKTISQSPGHSRSADIGIGHSMGGLTVREMDRQAIQGNQEKMFGGFIALGAPNQGTQFVNSFRTGSTNIFIASACKEVIADPLLSMTGSILNLFGVGGSASSIVATIQNFDGIICFGLSHLFTSSASFKDFTKPSIDDFAQSSTFLTGPNGLNAFTSTTHKVSFEGNENGPVHWRLFGADKFGVFDASSLHPDNANADQQLVNIMNDIENIELVAGIVFSAISISAIFSGAWNLVLPAAFAAYEFFDGYTWLQRSESKYNDIIGAFTSFQELQQMDLFVCVGERSSLEAAYQRGSINMIQYYSGVSALYSNPNCYQHSIVNVMVPNNGASDGIVPLSRQMLPGAAGHKTIDGINHFEFRDHPDVKATFDLLFNGQIPMNEAARLFFLTP